MSDDSAASAEVENHEVGRRDRTPRRLPRAGTLAGVATLVLGAALVGIALRPGTAVQSAAAPTPAVGGVQVAADASASPSPSASASPTLSETLRSLGWWLGPGMVPMTMGTPGVTHVHHLLTSTTDPSVGALMTVTSSTTASTTTPFTGCAPSVCTGPLSRASSSGDKDRPAFQDWGVATEIEGLAGGYTVLREYGPRDRVTVTVGPVSAAGKYPAKGKRTPALGFEEIRRVLDVLGTAASVQRGQDVGGSSTEVRVEDAVTPLPDLSALFSTWGWKLDPLGPPTLASPVRVTQSFALTSRADPRLKAAFIVDVAGDGSRCVRYTPCPESPTRTPKHGYLLVSRQDPVSKVSVTLEVYPQRRNNKIWPDPPTRTPPISDEQALALLEAIGFPTFTATSSDAPIPSG